MTVGQATKRVVASTIGTQRSLPVTNPQCRRSLIISDSTASPYSVPKEQDFGWNARLPADLAPVTTTHAPVHPERISPMRLLLAIALAFASVSAFAEDQTPAPAATVAATNTVDPVDGKPIDKTIAPIAAKTSDGKDVMIGASSNDNATKIKADPAKYADAAAKDQVVKDDAAQ